MRIWTFPKCIVICNNNERLSDFSITVLKRQSKKGNMLLMRPLVRITGFWWSFRIRSEDWLPFYLQWLSASCHQNVFWLPRLFPPGMGCNECTHPTCQHSLNSLGIGQCVECDGGVLVLDPTSGPKWRMACNKCNVVVHFFEHAHKIQVRKSYPVAEHSPLQTWNHV